MSMNSSNTSMRKPVDWDDLYPGRFLKAGQFGDKKVTLTISDVNLEKLAGDDGKEKVKGIVSFKETEMAIPLNKTNGICFREMFGREIPKWVGRRVTLFASEWNGEPCIRVWGSPEIEADRMIEVKLPKKKPIRMTLHAMRKAAPQAVKQASEEGAQREPGDEGP